jgi:hypothetical protein
LLIEVVRSGKLVEALREAGFRMREVRSETRIVSE